MIVKFATAHVRYVVIRARRRYCYVQLYVIHLTNYVDYANTLCGYSFVYSATTLCRCTRFLVVSLRIDTIFVDCAIVMCRFIF